ncbi:MAG TPA: Maf family protein [Anaerolineae bacterium]|nr:Maf family protein [Anaerolineae bacterium]
MLLASGSPRRRELLRLLGMPFQVATPDTREDAETASDGVVQASTLAERKALHVAGQSPADLVIAADTLVVLDDQVMGKPPDAGSAREMLRALRGREHNVISGLAVVSPGNALPTVQAVKTRVWMRYYRDEELADYIASGEPFDKAGAYAIQDARFHPVERIEGCYANVMGLPLCHLFAILARLGLAPSPCLTSPRRACEKHLGRKCEVAERILGAIDH